MKPVVYIVRLILLLSILSGCGTSGGSTVQEIATPRTAGYPQRPADLVQAVVVRVIDGDTVDVRMNGRTERLRLIGINTPESVDPRRPVECFGREASARAKQLLDGQTIGLEPDPSQANRDDFGRLLRFAWLDDGRLFNLEMITQGYAYEYTYNLPYKYQAVFQQAERAAREGQAGLWSQQTCAGRRAPDGLQTASPAAPATNTATPSRHDCPAALPVKGNINSRGDRIYHTPDSPSYAQVVPEQCFATPADAEAAGFRAVR